MFLSVRAEFLRVPMTQSMLIKAQRINGICHMLVKAKTS
jgi:hypothetical protein